MSHVPVLLPEVLRALNPSGGEHYIDGTFGAGGYTRAILNAADCNVTGLDRDPTVAPFVEKLKLDFKDKFSFKRTAFSQLDEDIKPGSIDGVVLDIGVSSMQLDQGERGFSFMRAGPLDMRMSAEGPTAADAVNLLNHNELVDIFKVYGEEKRARRCADFIIRGREEKEIATTERLADLISQALGRAGKHHPATRVFQALRIYINDELGELYKALLAAERVLKPGGRLVVVTFHSLEDRIVKSFLRTRSEQPAGGSRHLPQQEIVASVLSFDVSKRSGVTAGQDEVAENPRARSARLRWGVRTATPAWSGDEQILPDVPGLDVLRRRIA